MDPHSMSQPTFLTHARAPVASCNIADLLRYATLVLALLMSVAVQAQVASTDTPAEPTPWYQIEVLIFANDDPYAAGPERWPDDIELSYPQRIVALSSLPPRTSAATDRTATSPNPMAEPEPFVALEQSELHLTQVAARVLRQRDFRLLFHQAWRQPTTSREDSISLLVRGGDSFDDHRELEGWIQLSVERYLHFRTDLWLNSFKSTAGLDTLPWPRLPKLPVLAPITAPDPVLNPAAPQPAIDDPLTGSLSDLSFGSQMPVFNLTGRQYVVDKTVVLRQSRRMRSDELHYIDHPLMGILVKVSPYELATEADGSEQHPTSEAPLSAVGTGG